MMITGSGKRVRVRAASSPAGEAGGSGFAGNLSAAGTELCRKERKRHRKENAMITRRKNAPVLIENILFQASEKKLPVF